MAAGETIRKVAVIGAGTMGPGIALVFAAHGYEVALCDSRPEALARAGTVMRAALEAIEKARAWPGARLDTAMARVHPTTSLAEAGAQADLVLEAVYENRAVKQEVLAALDQACPAHTIFASNTSYLDVFSLSPRPARTVIAHWFAPPHILPLVEVVRGPQTEQAVVDAVAATLRAAGKVAVVIERFVPGFAVNRLQRAIGQEVLYLLENGIISPQDLDLAVKASIAPRMMLLGVVQRYDFAGLDLAASNFADEQYAGAPRNLAPRALTELVQAGHLGVKSGKGFYDYGRRPLEEVLRARDEALLDILHQTQAYLTPSLPLGDEPEDPAAEQGG